MLPLRDQLPTRTVPFINYLLMALSVLAFLWQLALMDVGQSGLMREYGLVPRHFLQDPLLQSSTILTSMFMHGGWMHLGGNMLYLWIFGDNVEDAVGHFRYLVFYLLGGLGAALAQIAVDPSSTTPMVGASGAIAAVLAAYVSLYPQSPITVFNPLWFLFGPYMRLPAWIVIIVFFFLPNASSAIGSLSMPSSGGVAFAAHVGGFVVGLVLIRIFMIDRDRRGPERWRGWTPPSMRGGAWR